MISEENYGHDHSAHDENRSRRTLMRRVAVRVSIASAFIAAMHVPLTAATPSVPIVLIMSAVRVATIAKAAIMAVAKAATIAKAMAVAKAATSVAKDKATNAVRAATIAKIGRRESLSLRRRGSVALTIPTPRSTRTSPFA